MLKRNCLALTLLVSFLISASILQVQAQGGTIVLNPTDDAYTDGTNYNSNYGSEPELKTLGFGRYLTWLKFDLSSIPDGAVGITAVLELYTIYSGVTEPHGVVACLILNNFNNSWTEDTITANNHPPYPDDAELDTEFVANDETWYEWIVTEAIVNATASDATAVTIVMRSPYGLQTPEISFTSKEGSLTRMPRLTVTWTSVNQRPVAILDVNETNPDVNETVTFDASASTDDGQIDYYFFDFGDGTSSDWTPLSAVTHKYAEEGVFNATLIVMDDFGATSLDGDSVYVEITVIPEFPSFLILPLLMVTSLLAVTVCRRMNIKQDKQALNTVFF